MPLVGPARHLGLVHEDRPPLGVVYARGQPPSTGAAAAAFGATAAAFGVSAAALGAAAFGAGVGLDAGAGA